MSLLEALLPPRFTAFMPGLNAEVGLVTFKLNAEVGLVTFKLNAEVGLVTFKPKR